MAPSARNQVVDRLATLVSACEPEKPDVQSIVRSATIGASASMTVENDVAARLGTSPT